MRAIPGRAATRFQPNVLRNGLELAGSTHTHARLHGGCILGGRALACRRLHALFGVQSRLSYFPRLVFGSGAPFSFGLERVLGCFTLERSCDSLRVGLRPVADSTLQLALRFSLRCALLDFALLRCNPFLHRHSCAVLCLLLRSGNLQCFGDGLNAALSLDLFFEFQRFACLRFLQRAGVRFGACARCNRPGFISFDPYLRLSRELQVELRALTRDLFRPAFRHGARFCILRSSFFCSEARADSRFRALFRFQPHASRFECLGFRARPELRLRLCLELYG
jgi:hypothetical protein